MLAFLYRNLRLLLFSAILLSNNKLSAFNTPLVADSLEARGSSVVREYWKEEAFDDVLKDELRSVEDTLLGVGFSVIKEKYNSEEFNYDEATVNHLSFWDRLERRISQILGTLFPKWGYQSDKVTENILVFLGIFALAYIIYRLLFSGNRILMKNTSETTAEEALLIEKNLESVNLDDYIQRAINGEKFELAIRYLHLANLQALAKSGHVVWDYRKTNSEFLYEIKNDDLQTGFRRTTSIFNYVWFGDFKIDAAQFERHKVDFIDFRNQISK